MADRNFAATASFLAADLTRRAGLSGFGAWWTTELTGIAPSRLRGALARRKLRAVLAIDGDRVGFWRPVLEGDSYRMQEVTTLVAGSDAAAFAAEGRAALATLIAPGAPPVVTIALPPRQVLRRTLTLPAAVADNLRATVGYDLDRLTPFKPEDVYYDAVVSTRDAARGTITADVVAARRRIVDQAVALARTFGADVAAVVPAVPEQAALARLDLLPSDDRRDGGAWTRWQVLVPLVVLTALIAAAVLLPIWQKRADTIALMRAAAAESVRAQESDKLRSDLERVTAEYNFPLERKLAHPGAGQVLDEVTRLLPEDTWLTQLELKTQSRGSVVQRDVFIRGESANAGRLVSLLEDAKYVGQATPRSPTTKLQPGPGESFDLALKVKDLALPATVALAETVPVASERPRAAVMPPPATAAATGTTASTATTATTATAATAPPAEGIAARGPGASAPVADAASARRIMNGAPIGEDMADPPAGNDAGDDAPAAAPGARGGRPQGTPGVPRVMPPDPAAPSAPSQRGFGPFPRNQ